MSHRINSNHPVLYHGKRHVSVSKAMCMPALSIFYSTSDSNEFLNNIKNPSKDGSVGEKTANRA